VTGCRRTLRYSRDRNAHRPTTREATTRHRHHWPTAPLDEPAPEHAPIASRTPRAQHDCARARRVLWTLTATTTLALGLEIINGILDEALPLTRICSRPIVVADRWDIEFYQLTGTFPGSHSMGSA
jgi:hypothetical protein